MAKFKRFDCANKKNNKHKKIANQNNYRKVRKPEVKFKTCYDEDYYNDDDQFST